MENFRLSQRDNNCTNCPFKSVCSEDYGTKCCNRLFVFMRALSVSNLQPLQCKPFKYETDVIDKEAYEKLEYINKHIEEFVYDGFNLKIQGKVGTGKTRWAIKLMLNYLSNMSTRAQTHLVRQYDDLSFKPTILFVDYKSIYTTLFDNDNYLHFTEQVKDADLVVFDDIGAGTQNSKSKARFEALLDMRVSCNKSNIYTTNWNPTSISEMFGPRVSSRMEYRCDAITLRGANRRPEQVTFLSKDGE